MKLLIAQIYRLLSHITSGDLQKLYKEKYKISNLNYLKELDKKNLFLKDYIAKEFEKQNAKLASLSSSDKTSSQCVSSKYHRSSFSQDGEDVVFKAFFEGKSSYKGFYVDIGAHHPERFSNTKILYDAGWKGINIDATPASMKAFEGQRPNDINLELGISDSESSLEYYSFEESALNSFDKELSDERISKGWKLKEIVKVKTNSLNNILEQYLPKNQKIDLITMDIEGLEMQVLKSFDFVKYAPDYFYIEDLDFRGEDFTKLTNSEVYRLLKEKGYAPVAKTMRTVLYQHTTSI